MKRNRFLSCSVIVVALLATSLACDSGPTEEELKRAAQADKFGEIETCAKALKQARDELAAATASVAEIEAVAEAKRSDEQKQQLEELTAQIPALSTTVDETFEKEQDLLQTFLSAALNDFPDLPELEGALRIYSEEAIIGAETLVRESGNYKKALESLSNAVKNYDYAEAYEPCKPLLDKIAELENWRFVTPERFGEVKKGMTPDEVKEIVGPPYYLNIQEQKGGIKSWLYPHKEGGAAAVHFNKKEKVYHMQFDAVKPKVVGADEPEG